MRRGARKFKGNSGNVARQTISAATWATARYADLKPAPAGRDALGIRTINAMISIQPEGIL